MSLNNFISWRKNTPCYHSTVSLTHADKVGRTAWAGRNILKCHWTALSADGRTLHATIAQSSNPVTGKMCWVNTFKLPSENWKLLWAVNFFYFHVFLYIMLRYTILVRNPWCSLADIVCLTSFKTSQIKVIDDSWMLLWCYSLCGW